MPRPTANVGTTERWLSLLAGLGLLAAATLRGSPWRRAALAVAGLSLLPRAATSYCAVKASMKREAPVAEGFREQWLRMRTGLGGTSAVQIDSMESLYISELQELFSAESQLSSLLERLTGTLYSAALEKQLRGYATELRSRHQDLARIISGHRVNPQEHPDQAMKALVNEVDKMSKVYGANIRDAALVASLQRLIHYKLAGYGSVAADAKTLGRLEDAARLAEYGGREQAIDRELTELAKKIINPQARMQPEARVAPAAAATAH